jgi:hypothetical protein
MKPSRYLIFLLPLLLTACGLSPQQKADYAAVEQSGVTPAIYDKMLHDDDLSIHDIEALSRAHVNGAIILRYIRDHGTVYFLTTADVTAMQKAGVDPSVIDYMMQTARGGVGPYPYWDYGPYGPYGPWWYGPGFYGGYIGFHGHYGGGHYGGHHH